jgi:hypothetical protein
MMGAGMASLSGCGAFRPGVYLRGDSDENGRWRVLHVPLTSLLEVGALCRSDLTTVGHKQSFRKGE